MRQKGTCAVAPPKDSFLSNCNFVKRQLKFDKPMYLFTKTNKLKTKTKMFYDKNNALFMYLMEKTSS